MDALWSRHNASWRHSAQVCSQWQDADRIDPRLLKFETRGKWWETVEKCGIVLIVSREYEHLLLALSVAGRGPDISYMVLPHPSGIAVDRKKGIVHVASTRNPNQIYDFAPVNGSIKRGDMKTEIKDRPLVPVRSRYFPGSLYMHDLAMVGGKLHANAVGHNAVAEITEHGFRRVWWPKCIEKRGAPVFEMNYLQLNSIAAGSDLRSSFFSASTDMLGVRRPGHRNFPVDKRGVIFSGKTREPIARGLTRPHSARMHKNRIWVDNSGYGEVGFIDSAKFCSVTKLPGWTRGLCTVDGIAFAGTSRVLPRFRNYAPGLDVDKSVSGLHALDMQTGRVLGSIYWPYGNQIFAVESISNKLTTGLPFRYSGQGTDSRTELFYAYTTNLTKGN